MLKGVANMSRARASARTCPAISPAVRLRTSPILPVRQNAQPMAQPTCVEMQKVCAGVSGMKTDSIWRPSPSRRTNFRVPSSETSCRAMAGVPTTAACWSAALNSRLRSVMPAMSVTSRFQIHR